MRHMMAFEAQQAGSYRQVSGLVLDKRSIEEPTRREKEAVVAMFTGMGFTWDYHNETCQSCGGEGWLQKDAQDGDPGDDCPFMCFTRSFALPQKMILQVYLSKLPDDYWQARLVLESRHSILDISIEDEAFLLCDDLQGLRAAASGPVAVNASSLGSIEKAYNDFMAEHRDRLAGANRLEMTKRTPSK